MAPKAVLKQWQFEIREKPRSLAPASKAKIKSRMYSLFEHAARQAPQVLREEILEMKIFVTGATGLSDSRL
ncbi:hypothetical protein [Tunturibacter empetritectus]|uniref:Uncharacterized protein n=1 Tax=Tunturiibacter lichenicola TaxID=2051959 RepID=A0A852VAH2_9BACT|nr:hypothetical protein [Edaphobacter lichenicola]NYF88301.1 hypothetical protein [Edaphobacter lichenicola]